MFTKAFFLSNKNSSAVLAPYSPGSSAVGISAGAQAVHDVADDLCGAGVAGSLISLASACVGL
jgi:hypothetical protein